MRELRDRDLIRSWNNPVADYAERLVAEELQLELALPVAQGYDATDAAGCRYQIKARRLTPQNQSCQLGVVRKLDQAEFDYLIAALFSEDLVLLEMWKIPYQIVAEFGRWVPTLNGHRIYVSLLWSTTLESIGCADERSPPQGGTWPSGRGSRPPASDWARAR